MAQAYGDHLFHSRRWRLIDEKKFSESKFHVGLGVDGGDLAHITKRGALVCDTLLLSHGGEGGMHHIGGISRPRDTYGFLWNPFHDVWKSNSLYMRCPDPAALGQWIIDAEPLLRAGIAWYLPAYSIQVSRRESLSFESYNQQLQMAQIDGREAPELSWVSQEDEAVPTALDFLVSSGKAIEQSESQPLKSQVVRPVLEISLPFVDGVGLRDFSEITVNEFGAYAGFQGFLRQAFLELDEGLQAVQSERELVKIGHRIEEEVRGVQSQMNSVRRKRAVSITGAAIGTVSATLVAVYGPVFEQAVMILGAAGAGGVWGIIQSVADNSPQVLRENKWYYVWALAKQSDRYGL
ncbi:hypothetical protein ABZX30_29410 [Streptomyces sp. NPDC004542]|uniref:hypothetical protein n=1 Tax=Streptomyces sp. NPDC004542 TaxID=3154281 RepID=UPI0033B82E50